MKYIIIIENEYFEAKSPREIEILVKQEYDIKCNIVNWFIKDENGFRNIPKFYIDYLQFVGTDKEYKRYLKGNYSLNSNNKERKYDNNKRKCYIVVNGNKIITETREDLIQYMRREYNANIKNWLYRRSIPKRFENTVTEIGFLD